MKALIAIDGSTESGLAVETAASLAWPSRSRLEVLTVLPTDAQLSGGPWAMGFAYLPTQDLRNRLEADGQRIVDVAVARLRRPGLDVMARLAHGRAASVIVDTARQEGSDLIILGARGHGVMEGALLGSVSAEVVDRAHGPVLVARRPSTARILIGTDGSAVATSAVAFVGGSGLFAAAETRVVHATDMHPDWWLGFTPGDAIFATDAYVSVVEECRRHASEVTSAAADLLRSNGLLPSTVILDGRPAPAIVSEARTWHADVVVVGTRGLGLLQRIVLGSTARSLLHHADASVLIVQGASTPVVTETSGTSTVPAGQVAGQRTVSPVSRT